MLFAAGCAERLAPIYRWCDDRTGWGRPEVYDAILTRLWASIGLQDLETVRSDVANADALILDDDGDHWSYPESAYAQNAAVALSYALRCRLTATPQDAAWAAVQVYDALMYCVEYRRNPEGHARSLALEQSHAELESGESEPLVQEQLASFADDIRALTVRPEPIRLLAEIFREKTRAGGAVILSALS